MIFLTPFAGYSTAAFTNATIHSKFGQRGIAIMAPVCHIITYAVLSAHPPFPVLVVINTISGFGNGLTDACFCAWVGAMDNANAVQGVMHSCYSVGALLAPLIATSMIVTSGLPWYTFYYFMVSDCEPASVPHFVGPFSPPSVSDFHAEFFVLADSFRVLANNDRSVPRRSNSSG